MSLERMRKIYINYIQSCMNGLPILTEAFPEQHADVIKAIESLNSKDFYNAIGSSRMTRNGHHATTNGDVVITFENRLRDFGWRGTRNKSGLVNNGISTYIVQSNSIVDSLLFSRIPRAIRNSELNLPIIISIDKKSLGILNTLSPQSSSFEFISRHLNNNSPLPVNFPFLLLGVSFEYKEPTYGIIQSAFEEVREPGKEYIDRSIEFPSEYYQAGLGILSYFNKILKEKYPNTPSNVKIIQDGYKVRMIIETDTGHTEIIEKALIEYQQIIAGELKPEAYLTDQIQIINLKNEIRILTARLESQADIISLQNSTLSTFTHLLREGLDKVVSTPPTINFAPVIQIDNHINQQQIVQNNISQLLDDLEELKSHLSHPDSKLLQELEEIQGELVDINEQSPPIKKEGFSKKLTNFITKVKNVDQGIDKTIAVAKDGIGILSKIIKHYNYLAVIIGLPSIDFLNQQDGS